MIEAAPWIPSLVEMIALLIGIAGYLLPAVLAGMTIGGGSGFTRGLCYGAAFTVCYYSLVGFALSAMGILTSLNLLIVWMLTVAALAVALLTKARIPKIRVEKEKLQKGIFLALAFFLVFMIYYVWEGKASGIGAWDRSEHLVKLLYLVHHSRLPVSEIGMDANAFYPEGFNLNAFMFVSLVRVVVPNIAYDVALIGFFAFCTAFLVLPVQSLALKFTGSAEAGLLAVICFVPSSYLLIFESMPSGLAMVLVGVVLLETISDSSMTRTYLITVPLLSGILIIHAVIFLYTVLILLAIALSRSRGLRGLISNGLSQMTIATLGGAGALCILFVCAPSLLAGTLANAFTRIPASSIAHATYTIPFSSFLPSKWEYFGFYVYTILPILPAFVYGSFYCVRNKDAGLIGLLLGSIYISLAGFAQFDNRIRFFMLYPIAIITSIGFTRALQKLQTVDNAKITRSVNSRWIMAAVTTSFVIISVVAPITNAALGFGNATSNWNLSGRTNTYLDDEAFLFVDWMIENNLSDIGVIATPSDGVYYQIVESMTDNKILMASTWNAPQSFADIREFFNESVPVERKHQIAEYYNITAYLVRGNPDDFHLYDTFPNSTIYEATGIYTLVVIKHGWNAMSPENRTQERLEALTSIV
jgi:hypothetical protein